MNIYSTEESRGVSSIIEDLRFGVTIIFSSGGGTLGLVLAAVGFFFGIIVSVQQIFLLLALFLGLGALVGRSVQKRFIRSEIRKMIELLEDGVRRHPEVVEQELREFLQAVKDAELKLEQLPAKQEERLASLQKKLAEMQRVLASLE